jgi:putative endonuclease
MPFFLYILQSETSGRYYVGQTQDLKNRLEYHNANYSLALRNRGPWKLVHHEAYESRKDAVRRECYIKSQKSRKFIEVLISLSSSVQSASR